MSTPRPSSVHAVAVEVRDDWEPQSSGQILSPNYGPYLSVEKGEQAWCYQTTPDLTLAFIGTLGNSPRRGWVPTYALLKGNPEQDPPPIDLPTQFNDSSGASTTITSQNVLQQTLRHLWQTISRNKDLILNTLPGLSDDAKKIMFHPHAAQYGDMVYDSLIPGSRNIMANGKFDPSQLRQLPAVSHAYTSKEVGIYAIVYGNFGGRSFGSQQYQEALYIGQTVDFQNRDASHQSFTNKSHSNHYHLAAAAKSRKMIPIIFGPKTDMPPDFLDIAEFSMVLLFQTWHPTLFKPSNVNLIGSYGVDFEAAQIFANVARKTARETGWEPTSLLGLNWITPIIRNQHADQKWVSWYEPSRQAYMHRTRRTLYKFSEDRAQFNWATGRDIAVPGDLLSAAQFTNGQILHITAELQIDSNRARKPHPFRWARLPTNVGRNEELEKLDALAIKIEWLSPGGSKWQCAYLLPDDNNILYIYRTGLMMLMDITETSYSGGPSWLPQRPQTPVQRLEYDHLGQKLTVKTLQPRVIPWPQDNSIQQNAARLRENFPLDRFPAMKIGVKPDRMPEVRAACDLCVSQRTTTQCQFMQDRGSCQFCILLNRPCTFTPIGMVELIEGMKQNGQFEELGIPVNIGKLMGGLVLTLPHAPFDPNVEDEEHAELAAED